MCKDDGERERERESEKNDDHTHADMLACGGNVIRCNTTKLQRQADKKKHTHNERNICTYKN